MAILLLFALIFFYIWRSLYPLHQRIIVLFSLIIISCRYGRRSLRSSIISAWLMRSTLTLDLFIDYILNCVIVMHRQGNLPPKCAWLGLARLILINLNLFGKERILGDIRKLIISLSGLLFLLKLYNFTSLFLKFCVFSGFVVCGWGNGGGPSRTTQST